MTLSTIGSIATHIYSIIGNIPVGISGAMIDIVDNNRQHVSNFTGNDIGSNSIEDKFIPVIVNYSKADVIDMLNAQGAGEKITLGELSIDDSQDQMSADAWRLLADSQLKAIGRRVTFVRSLG